MKHDQNSMFRMVDAQTGIGVSPYSYKDIIDDNREVKN